MKVRRCKFSFAACFALLVHRNLQELHGRNAWNFDRVLEGRKSLGSTFGRVQLQNALAIVENVARGHFIVFAAERM